MNKPYTVTIRLKTFTVHDSAHPEGKNYPHGAPLRASQDIERLARAVYAELDADKEHFTVFCLNNKNRLDGFKVVSTGTITASMVHPSAVFATATELRAVSLIFVHNHPSGDPAPSPEDLKITQKLKQAGEIMGVQVLDHVILGGDGRYFSFSDNGSL